MSLRHLALFSSADECAAITTVLAAALLLADVLHARQFVNIAETSESDPQ